MLDVTLDWFKDMGVPVFTDNTDPAQQTLATDDLALANLDLEIWDASFTTMYAISESEYNNAQELHFTLPVTGDYGIRVIYPKTMYGTATAETYGLAWDVQDVPEPSTVMLLGWTVCAGLAAGRWRRSETPVVQSVS